MPITVGPVIGYAEVNGQSYVDVPVTTAVPVGDPTTAHSVIAIAVSREEYTGDRPTGDSGSLANKYPVITDDRPISGPYNQPNKTMGTTWWTGDATGATGGAPYSLSHGSSEFGPPAVPFATNYTFRGGYQYLMLAGLDIGDTVRVDYRGKEGNDAMTPLAWLAVRLHRIDGLHAEHEPAATTPWASEPFASAVASGIAFSSIYPDTSNPDPSGFNLGWVFGNFQFLWGFSTYPQRDAWEPLHSGEEFFHFKVQDEFDIDQQYTFHNELYDFGPGKAGLQIGYAFHDWEDRIGSAHPAVVSYRGNSPESDQPEVWGITQLSPGPGWPIVGGYLHLENLI